MNKNILNSWTIAAVIILMYDAFLFVVLNLLNPKGNEWTVLDFLLLTGSSVISIGTLYISSLATKYYFKTRPLSIRYSLAFLMSLPLFMGLYLCYWVFFIRSMIFGLETSTNAYASQLFFKVTAMHLPVACIVLSTLYYSQAHKAELQLVKAQGLVTEIQLKNLQQQVDPHFLFNSLNILTALIRQDADKSVLFTQKLSEVYRFFLKTKQDILIPLDEELSFVKDYFYLVECRFGNSFRLDIDESIESVAQQMYVIPGTVQLLAENVIKHNMADEEMPIVIRISIHDDSLVVANRVVKKQNASSGYGLTNLAQRYELVNEKKVTYSQEDGMFFVCIPLIKKLS